MALIQTAVLGYMVESRASILRNGVDVRLKTAPVDPRDLLRGDYVTLGYAISTIDRSIIVGETPKAAGRQTMAVRLVPGADGLWSASQASFAPLPEQPGSVVVRTLPFDYYPGADGAVPETIFVSYGIERYYVPEGEGRVLEEARNAQALEVAARVSLGPAGCRSGRSCWTASRSMTSRSTDIPVFSSDFPAIFRPRWAIGAMRPFGHIFALIPAKRVL